MQRDILPHSHVLAIRIAQHLANHTAPAALDPAHLARGVIRQRAADLLRFTQRSVSGVQDTETNALLLPEVAFDGDDADGEQVRFVAEGGVGAGVDVDCAVRGEAVEEPKVAVADGGGGGQEAGVEGWEVGFCEGGAVGYDGDCVDGSF